MDEFTALFSRKDMTFEEAVAYFKERVPVTASRFYQIAAEYRALAFTVSGYTKAQVLKKFYDELLAALEEGNSLAEFRENMNDFLEAEGYARTLRRGIHIANLHPRHAADAGERSRKDGQFHGTSDVKAQERRRNAPSLPPAHCAFIP